MNDKELADVNLPEPRRDSRREKIDFDPLHLFVGVLIFGMPLIWVGLQVIWLLVAVFLSISGIARLVIQM